MRALLLRLICLLSLLIAASAVTRVMRGRSPALSFAIIAALNLFAFRSAQGITYTFVDLTPSGIIYSEAHGVSGGQQVGFGDGPATGNAYHAMLWSGSASSAVDLNPAGFTASEALGVSGGQQVGDGGGPATRYAQHALLWSGSAASVVDLNPLGFGASKAFGISGAHQVGYGYVGNGPDAHALLWSGSSSSAVDLNPAGFTASEALGVSGGQQVGDGYINNSLYPRALLWSGTAASVVDLQSYLSSDYTKSKAVAIDAAGDIVGAAVYGPTGLYHAIEWIAVVPEPSTGPLVIAGLLGLAWRRARA